MEVFAKRLRDRARELGLSDAEVARRAGLAERRYGHYTRGARQPDFQTLLRICQVLGVTPNDLLIKAQSRLSQQGRWQERLRAAGAQLDVDDLRMAVAQVEVIVDYRRK
ncbi:helix-turn-helix domain-containing protein [Bradyrhizobium sp. USDA 4515]